MKRTTTLIAVASMMTVLATLFGCGGPRVATRITECVAPDDAKTEAPLWVCDAPWEGMAAQGVGSFRPTAAGIDFQKDQASASARNQIARQAHVKVQAMIKQFAETTGGVSNETVDQVNTSVSKQITGETLVNSQLLQTWVNPNSRYMYIIIGINKASFAEATKKAVRTSMSNDAALWQQLKGQKSQDDLADEIVKTEK